MKIIRDPDLFGLCEKHYQMCNVPDGGTLHLEWDDFDAFRQAEETEDGTKT